MANWLGAYKVAAKLNKLGPGSCIALPADLQKLDDVKKLVAELSKRESRTSFSIAQSIFITSADTDVFPCFHQTLTSWSIMLVQPGVLLWMITPKLLSKRSWTSTWTAFLHWPKRKFFKTYMQKGNLVLIIRTILHTDACPCCAPRLLLRTRLVSSTLVPSTASL